MTIASNLSLQELVKYSNDIDAIKNGIDGLFEELELAKKEMVAERKRNELLSEQLYFAREVLYNLEAHLDKCTSAKQARDAFVRCLENGYFER